MIYLDHLLKATLGKLVFPGKQIQFAAFSHDTRTLTPGELFVAVRGERGNGHDYVMDAVRKGAEGLLLEARGFQHLSEQTQSALLNAEVAVMLVEDTRMALQQYARAILDLWHPTVIAVTGGVGKTSTKEAIATVLSNQYTTFRSWQNYNDLLGIPLSLGRLEARHEYAVLELGCDHPGEITDLCHMLRPHIGVLTNISPVQLQYFGTLERLAQELGSLLYNLPAQGHFFYNQDDAAISNIVRQYQEAQTKQVYLHPLYSTREGQVAITRNDWDGIEARLQEKQSEPKEVTLKAPLLGTHNLNTIVAAYQVGVSRGMHPQKVRQAIAQIKPLAGRLQPLPGIQQSRILDDTHNASPAAIIAGLTTVAALTEQGGRRIAVLGDMLHLGEYEDEAHFSVGRQVAEYADFLVTRGERAALIAEAAQQAGLRRKQIIMTSSHEDAARAVKELLAASVEPGKDVVLIKGSEETRMERVTEMLLARPWEASEKLVRQTPGWKKTFFMQADRPTWVEIDLNAIGSNTRHLKSMVGEQVQVLVALKADAYGHGALKVARTVLQNGASMLGVATVTEAVPLRESHIIAPILVFGYVPRWQMREAVRLDVGVTLYGLEAARELSRAAVELDKKVRVHVKVDTGMGRLGIWHENIEEISGLLQAIKTLPNLIAEGIYTHFAQADASDQTHVRQQLTRFQQVLQSITEQGLRPPIVHAANSAATIALPEAHFDMVRPGIAIYGLDPSPDVALPDSFRPALSFKTQVSQVKLIPAGEGISYGSTYITERPTCIAILPVGYADGFRRSPQNWGSVLVHGQEAPLLGRVCMDQCMIDVTHIPDVRVGDEVVLIGRQGEAELSAEAVATRLGTINYEVVSEILARVPRID